MISLQDGGIDEAEGIFSVWNSPEYRMNTEAVDVLDFSN